MIDEVQDCCKFAISSLDGLYGAFYEIIALVIFIFLFNFVLKRLIRYLHLRFEKQHQIWKNSFVNAIYKPLTYYLWFFPIIQILDVIAFELSYPLSIYLRHRLLAAGALIAFTWFLFRWKRLITIEMVHKSMTKEISIDHGKISAIDKLMTIFISFFFILMLLEVTDRSLNTIIAFSGVGGLALAIASQEVISNFFGGFMIYLTEPFTIGDLINVPDHKIEGHVEEIGWYMTRIRSLDKKPIYIPNSIFSKLIIITPSRMSHHRIKEVLSIQFEDLPKLKNFLYDVRQMLETNPNIDQAEEINVVFSEIGQYSLVTTINYYTPVSAKISHLNVKEECLFKIITIMEKHHLEFADLNVYNQKVIRSEDAH